MAVSGHSTYNISRVKYIIRCQARNLFLQKEFLLQVYMYE